MAVYDSFIKPGAVPFKWEIRPGQPPLPPLSTPRSHSERWRFDRPVQVHLECVSHGCFPSPLLRRKGSKRRSQKSEPDYVSDLETLSRWLVSSRKSLSPFYGSPVSSFLSFRSSP
ncbi:hypothetical protein GOBAR_DD16598 [Gossypium barbadense]|nr:hypothetical protein GOBAR_DD16598 [Gossypium barbadense]